MTERKLNAWVAIAEIISAAAVVISLIYGGLEVRLSTLESEADIQAELLSYTVQRRYLFDIFSRIKCPLSGRANTPALCLVMS